MIYLVFLWVFLPVQSFCQDSMPEETRLRQPLLSQPNPNFHSTDPSHTEIQIDPTPSPQLTAQGHPILAHSPFAKAYTEKTTLICFLSKKWFRWGSFLSSTAAAALAGIAYGVNDTDIKNQCNLAILISTVLATTFSRMEGYANDAVNDHENEYQMFQKPDH